jgi:hypothetical protein
MNCTAYHYWVSVSEIITSENYDNWFQDADTLKGSKKLVNLKELRAKTDAHEFRIDYIFDPERKGLLLIGGDKKSKNQKKFYKDLIRETEQIYATYLEKRIKEKEKENGISPFKRT